jgi:hypothetical protein
MLAWLAMAEIATALWYRAHESGVDKGAPWTIEWPAARFAYHEITIPQAARSILHYNEGQAAAWQNADGTLWSMFYLRWFPGRSAAQLARAHGPEICLPASGRTLQADLGVKFLEVRGITLSVHEYVFLNRGQPMHVFYSLYEEGAAPDPTVGHFQRLTLSVRMQAVFFGKRNAGQRVLEVTIFGLTEATAAEAAFVNGLTELIRTES